MLRSYLKGAKHHSWLSCPDCPMAVRECKILFDQAYHFPDGNPNITHDSLIVAIELSKATKVLHELQGVVGRQTVVLHAHVKDKTGVVYSCASTRLGNSLILFYPHGNHSLKPVPGSIQYICEEDESFIFTVQRQLPLVDSVEVSLDPFAAYPHFPDWLYSAVLQETLEHVRFSWVVGHYTCWAVSDHWVVVLNLSRD
ncbi:hypothetical protein J3R83DRAFT_3990 [Lanmaoa asiatica]|nr:hypothetical protein J3R83DRAFT_3990 [Lanmaoa asiatica]